VHHQRFDQDILDQHARVEGRVRVLEDYLHVLPHPPKLLLVLRIQGIVVDDRLVLLAQMLFLCLRLIASPGSDRFGLLLKLYEASPDIRRHFVIDMPAGGLGQHQHTASGGGLATPALAYYA